MAKKTMRLYGRNSVIERLRSAPASVRKVFLQDSCRIPLLEQLMQQHGIAGERVSAGSLAKKMPAKDLQGVLAEVDLFSYTAWPELLSRAQQGKLSLLFLDGIKDPHNLGVIMRTAACFGGFGLVIPEQAACGVNETVIHVAAGGENYVPVARTTDAVAAIRQAKEKEIFVIGASVTTGAQEMGSFTFRFPLAVVLGAEGEGISAAVRNELEAQIYIPMSGAALSLNVNSAAAIICHHIATQRPR